MQVSKLQCLLIFSISTCIVNRIKCANVPNAVILRTQLHVNESRNGKTHVTRMPTVDGNTVGIIVKSHEFQKPMKNKKVRAHRSFTISNESIEIVGVRENDNDDDRQHVYRNAQFVNNRFVQNGKKFLI